MVIKGYLRDIQPNQALPTLELYFDTKARSSLPRGKCVAIILELKGARWSGTMNSANNTNPPYVHTNLTLSDGTRHSCTEVFVELGLAEKARLGFDLAHANNLRLTETIDKGKWRSGNAPQERAAKTGKSIVRSTKAVCQQASSKSGTSFPLNDREEILRLAGLYWNLISAGEATEERVFEEEMPAARKAGFLTKSLFVRL